MTELISGAIDLIAKTTELLNSEQIPAITSGIQSFYNWLKQTISAKNIDVSSIIDEIEENESVNDNLETLELAFKKFFKGNEDHLPELKNKLEELGELLKTNNIELPASYSQVVNFNGNISAGGNVTIEVKQISNNK